MYSLQTIKKSELTQTAQIELSINRNTKRSQMQINAYVSAHLRDMFYDSKIQLVQFTDLESGLESLFNNLQTRSKKAKRTILKALKHKSCLSLCTCQKKLL